MLLLDTNRTQSYAKFLAYYMMLDKKKKYTLLAIISILSLVIFKGCFPAKHYYPLKEPLKNRNIVINIDNAFTDEEEMMIAEAANSWEYVSNNTIKITLIFNKPKPDLFYRVLRYFKHPKQNIAEGNFIIDKGSFMWKLDMNDELHIDSEAYKFCGNKAGFFLKIREPLNNEIVEEASQIFAIENAVRTPNEFKHLVLHELGHYLRLNHMLYKHSVMHKTILNQVCITQWDAIQLCELYNCEPRPECFVGDSMD